MFNETVHFGQNFTIKCSKFSCFYIFLLIYFSSSFIIISLLFYIIIIIEEKIKNIKKYDVSYECHFVQSCIAHRPLSPVHCTSTTDHCALNIDRRVLCRVHRILCRVTPLIARRPLILVLRALVRAHRALHRGQSSSHGKRKTAPQWAPFFVLLFDCYSFAAASASSLASSARNFSIFAF